MSLFCFLRYKDTHFSLHKPHLFSIAPSLIPLILLSILLFCSKSMWNIGFCSYSSILKPFHINLYWRTSCLLEETFVGPTLKPLARWNIFYFAWFGSLHCCCWPLAKPSCFCTGQVWSSTFVLGGMVGWIFKPIPAHTDTVLCISFKNLVSSDHQIFCIMPWAYCQTPGGWCGVFVMSVRLLNSFECLWWKFVSRKVILSSLKHTGVWNVLRYFWLSSWSISFLASCFVCLFDIFRIHLNTKRNWSSSVVWLAWESTNSTLSRDAVVH